MIELSTDQQRDGLRALGRAFAAESDGKQLKKELAAELRKVVEPIKDRQVRQILAVRSSGHRGAGIRQAIARQTRAGVRFGGRDVGVNIIQRTRGMPRNFRFAGRAMNRAQGWSPQSLGGVVRQQFARPTGWFDDAGDGMSADAVRAASQVMERMAARLAARAGR